MGNRKQWCGESLGRNQVKGSCPRVSPGPDSGTAPTTLSSSVPPTPGTQPGCHLPTTPAASSPFHLSGPEPALESPDGTFLDLVPRFFFRPVIKTPKQAQPPASLSRHLA